MGIFEPHDIERCGSQLESARDFNKTLRQICNDRKLITKRGNNALKSFELEP